MKLSNIKTVVSPITNIDAKSLPDGKYAAIHGGVKIRFKINGIVYQLDTDKKDLTGVNRCWITIEKGKLNVTEGRKLGAN